MTMRWLSLLGLLATVTTAQAQQLAPNMTYDGRVTLARLKYTPLSNPIACQLNDSPAGIGWGHDYPMSVQGLLKAAKELTSVDNIETDSNLVLTIDDPEINKHPTLMLTEPGCWNPTDQEVKLLRNYLLKGGFLIADDYTFFDCTVEHCELAITRFEAWIKRVLPNAHVVRLSGSDPIFDGFFQVDPNEIPGYGDSPGGQVMGIYQDNDPSKRLLVVCNYWTTLGQYWRYAYDVGNGLEHGGTSYLLGLNYFIYGLSH